MPETMRPAGRLLWCWLVLGTVTDRPTSALVSVRPPIAQPSRTSRTFEVLPRRRGLIINTPSTLRRAAADNDDDAADARVEPGLTTTTTRAARRRDVLAEAVAVATIAAGSMSLPAKGTQSASSGGELGRVVSRERLLEFAQQSEEKKKKKHVVITGANSGVGLEGAKLLSAAGHRVTCACRTLEKASKAAEACGFDAHPAVCDLADLASVRRFAADLVEAGDYPVDALCLNAGLALNPADEKPRRTKDGFELTIGTNHLGHFLLYRLVEADLLLKRPRPDFRLVVTASPVHDPTTGGGGVGSAATLGDLAGLEAGPQFDMVDGGPFDADKAYKDSKLCNLLFAAEASRRLVNNNAGTVNSFSPGLIPAPNGFFKYQNPVFANVFNGIATLVGVAETAQFGGACLAFVAADASLDGVTNAWFDTEPPGKHQLLCHLPSAEARDLDKQKKLWALSSRLVGVSEA